MQWTRASVLGFAVFFYDTQMHEICGTKNLGLRVATDRIGSDQLKSDPIR